MNHSDDLWLKYTILTMMGPYYYKREMWASSLSMTFDTTDDVHDELAARDRVAASPASAQAHDPRVVAAISAVHAGKEHHIIVC